MIAIDQAECQRQCQPLEAACLFFSDISARATWNWYLA